MTYASTPGSDAMKNPRARCRTKSFLLRDLRGDWYVLWSKKCASRNCLAYSLEYNVLDLAGILELLWLLTLEIYPRKITLQSTPPEVLWHVYSARYIAEVSWLVVRCRGPHGLVAVGS